jgi:integrase
MSREVSLTVPGAAVRPVSNMTEDLASLKSVPYGEVFQHLEDRESARLEAEGLPRKRVSNFRTVRNGWMKVHGLTEDSPVGKEFGAGYAEAIERYETVLAYEGKTSQTIADRRSMMGAYREMWVDLMHSATAGVLEGDFTQALNRLIESSGMSPTHIARKAAICVLTFRNWCGGRHRPIYSSLPAVHRLEEVFGIPTGALAAKLTRRIFGGARSIRTGLTGYRKHCGEVVGLRYLLKEFTTTLQDEWGDIILFHTDAAWLRTRRLQRNSKWRVREHDNCCPTADLKRLQVSEFMGFLSLPADSEDPRLRGKGLPREELTLALLSDSDLIYGFLQFKRERTYLRRYNTSSYTFLVFCSSLLRPETGYLWQSPHMGPKLPAPVPAERWHEWCERQRSIINSTQKDLMREDEFRKTRDPFEPIRLIILNNQHPLDTLFELAAAYEADAPPRRTTPHQQAVHYQNLFLIRFATLVPLRAFNLSVLTWRRDGTGNLYQKPDGSWWVRVETSYLKNHKGAAKSRPFDVPLHSSLWPYIEELLFTHRPHLEGASVCDYVFRPSRSYPSRAKKDPGRAVAEAFLTRQVYTITQRYIPDCPGFSLHAFRHLVATEYIKNNPAGYAIAAAILHDKEETVRKNYAWVLPADKFGFWNDYVSTLLGDQEKEDDE